jgi:hypothetical protein
MNLWSLLVFLIARILVGMVWYSPIGFWNPWAAVTKITKKGMQEGMKKGMASDILGSLVMGFVLLYAIKGGGAAGNLIEGLKITFFGWLGLVATVQIGMTAYENRPLKFFWIVSGYQLVSMLIGGAALTLLG